MKLTLKYLSLIFLGLLFSCSKPASEKVEPTKESVNNIVQLTEGQFATVGIQVGALELRSISNTIKANGMLDVPPQNMVTVSAPLGGFVKDTELLQGMKVNKGQVIAVMEHPDYIQLQQDYLENKSQLSFYEAELKRQQELAKEDINSGKALQQAETNYQSTKAKVEGLKSRLQLINIEAAALEKGVIKNTINIYAPLSGFVTQVHVNLGMYVNPTDVLFKIVDTKHLHAEVVVFEKDVLRVKVGQKVRLRLANESSERMATVYLIGKEISPERTVRVHCHLDKEDVNLLPGMYFTALLESDMNQSPSLPAGAIVNFEGDNFVFLVKDQNQRIYEMIKISKGQSESGYSEVTLPDGISPDSQFVIVGTYDLLSYLKNTEEEE